MISGDFGSTGFVYSSGIVFIGRGCMFEWVCMFGSMVPGLRPDAGGCGAGTCGALLGLRPRRISKVMTGELYVRPAGISDRLFCRLAYFVFSEFLFDSEKWLMRSRSHES